MGFEYIYAYLENLQWFFYVGLFLSVISLIVFIVGRIINEIDIDDWKMLMGAAFCGIVFFGFFSLSPSMEHIQKVRTTVVLPYVENSITKEDSNETHYSGTLYPNADCANSLVCQGR